jgi:hypothetical protein
MPADAVIYSFGSTPLTVSEIQADKDALRAQFAMSVRRHEIGMEEMRAKTATWHDGVGKHTANSGRLQLELDKKTTLIFALRAREEVRKNIVQRMAKILLHIYMPSKRRRRPAAFLPQQYPQWELREAGPSELQPGRPLNVKPRQAVSRNYRIDRPLSLFRWTKRSALQLLQQTLGA